MVKPAPAVHRSIIAVDIEGFGDPARTLPHQLGTRAALYDVVEEALRAAGVPWDQCHIEDRGDAIFILIPPDTPKAPLVEVAPHALAQAVHAHNHTSHTSQHIRLRMAVHAGEVAFDGHGATSTAVTTTFRLLDAPPFKHALRDSPGLLALIVSQRVFTDIVHHSAALNPATFRPIEVRVKEVQQTAWIALPDQPYPADPTVLDHASDNLSPSSAATNSQADPQNKDAKPGPNPSGDRNVIVHGGVTGSGPGLTIGAITGDHTSIGHPPPDPHPPTRNQG